MVLPFLHSTPQILDWLTNQLPGIYELKAPMPLVWVTEPEVVVRILADPDGIFGKQERVAESVARGEKELLSGVVNEALRLYPPVWSVARQCTAPALLGSRPYETGTWFFISPWVQGRSFAGWDNPLDFEIERWQEEEVERDFFLPFGNGPRRCPGETMARTQIIAFLAILLRKWLFDTATNSRPPVPLFGVTQRPKNGIHLKISRR